MLGRTVRSSEATAQACRKMSIAGAIAAVVLLWVGAASGQGDRVIDLNKATVKALDTLPGIGPKKAQAIVAFRKRAGGFGHPLDLVQVSGIGPGTYAKLCRRIKVGELRGCNAAGEAPQPPMEVVDSVGDTRLNLNVATAEELRMLPGVGAKRAATILESRRSLGPFVKPADLKRIRGVGDKTFAHLEPFVRTTFDPNTASRTELSAVGVLSPAQIAALLAYRKGKDHAFDKLEDLKWVKGIDKQRLQRLAPFIAFWD